MLYYTTLHCSILYHTIQDYTLLYFTLLYFTLLCRTILHNTISYHIMLNYIIVYCIVLCYNWRNHFMLFYKSYHIIYYNLKTYILILSYHVISYHTTLHYLSDLIWFDLIHLILSEPILPRSFWVLAVKGGFPDSISKQRAPKDHQSTPFPYPLRVSISGAMYSLVPHSVRALSRSPISFAMRVE